MQSCLEQKKLSFSRFREGRQRPDDIASVNVRDRKMVLVREDENEISGIRNAPSFAPYLEMIIFRSYCIRLVSQLRNEISGIRNAPSFAPYLEMIIFRSYCIRLVSQLRTDMLSLTL